MSNPDRSLEVTTDPWVLDQIEAQPIWDSSALSAEQIAEAIDGLTEKQREAIEMVFWERLSIRQAAQKVGIHESSFRERLYLAYAKLRELLGVEGQ